MRVKFMFVLALVFSLITVGGIYLYLEDARAGLAETDMVTVIVARQDIPARTPVAAAMLDSRAIPADYKHRLELTRQADVVGKITLVPIAAGQSILSSLLVEPGETGEGLAYAIPESMKAMTISIDQVSGVAGMLRPGDRVDVITLIPLGESNAQPYSVAALQDIGVLAVGRVLEEKPGTDVQQLQEASTVTLAVTLEESLRLKMAAEVGKISLLLRSPLDDSRADPRPFKTDIVNYPNPFKKESFLTPPPLQEGPQVP